tara:strand:- start:2 stop:334 length:333 start_codon:yes stop_codon:yes gene_type:complete
MKFEFEKSFGKGTDPWYAKAERWAKKQRFPISFLALGVIEWLKNKWIDIKIENTMRDIDKQSEEIKKIWEQYDEEEAKQFAPEIIETPSEVEGLNDMMIGPRDDIDFYGY